ncbi:MAG: hypothetical protein E6G38_03650 [Actinobacteria bacterium]|nr:MAG: hypothetical protein E6G38_03650 [Actinomycetota bacterium]
MLADQLDYVIGVDPHRDAHALAVVEVRSGAVVFEASTLADAEGYVCLLRLADQHAPGRRAFAVEGTGSFGAGLTRFLRSSNKNELRSDWFATVAYVRTISRFVRWSGLEKALRC